MIDLAIQAAREAGAFLRENLGNVRNIEQKEGQARNLVSEIDKGSEARIIAMIRGKYPDHQILGEESGAHPSASDYKWVIDPLDGTTNYLHGVPIFAVTIGVEHKGEIIAGVTYDPNREELYTAERGSGAFLNGTRLHVTTTSSMVASLMVTGFPYTLTDDPNRTLEHFGNFAKAAQGIRRLGSAALDLAYVAAARCDGYWEVSLQPWDMAAGLILVREAGGIVTDFSGAPAVIYRRQVLATNGAIHTECLRILASSKA